MRRLCACTGLGVVVASPLAAVAALAAPLVSAPSSRLSTGSSDREVAIVFLVAVIVGALGRVVVGLVMAGVDRVRERRGDVTTLEVRIADALRVEPALGHLPFSVRAQAPCLRRAPVTIEIVGQVPTSTLQQTAIEVAVREAYEQVGASFCVENRIRVSPSIPHAA
jgi:hypothetical protein